MGYWLFKISDQKQYPDEYGKKYVYDNTHSRKVKKGDEFIYLDKRKGHKLTGAGKIERLTSRNPEDSEKRTDRVKTIYTAHFTDFIEFDPPLDLSNTKKGKENRRRLGAPEKFLAWGISIISISREQFTVFINAALENSKIIPSNDIKSLGTPIEKNTLEIPQEEWKIEDSYSIVRRRARLEIFRRIVLERHKYRCVVCGTTLKEVLEAAHIRRYAEDQENRANPANGICLCKYCHSAFDSDILSILPSGEIQTLGEITDQVAKFHFTQIDKETRRNWLKGVDLEFLKEKINANNKN